MRPEALRVLVVDDHSVVRRGTRRILEEAGIEVASEAATAEQVLEIIDHAAPDVVLADVRLPGMSGIELIAELRRHRPETRVLVLSSYNDPGYVRAALEAGAAGYMLKTASDEELIWALRSAPWVPRSSTRPCRRTCSRRARGRLRGSPTASGRSSGS